jgi:predicted nucleic acid-binding protein
VVEEFFTVALKRFAKPMSVSEAERCFSTVLRLCWLCILHPPPLESDCKRLYSEDFQHDRKIQDMRIENPFA